MLSRFFDGLSGRQRLLAFVLVVIVVALLVTMLTGGLLITLLMAAVILGFLWITKAIWLPEGYGNTRVRLASLTVVMAVAVAVVGGRLWFEPIVLAGLESILDPEGYASILDWVELDGLITALVLGFVLIAVYIVNFSARGFVTLDDQVFSA